MIEYRVGDKKAIGQLYDHLEKAIVEYHARDLIEAQRPQIVREIEV